MYTCNIGNLYFFSDDGFIGEDGQYYEPRLKNPALLRTSLMDGFYAGSSTSDYGDVVLMNTDGRLYSLKNEMLEGKRIEIYQDGSLMVDSIILGVSYQQSTMNLTVKDPSAILGEKFSSDVYLGNNILPDGIEGGTNIKGNPKLKMLGKVSNIAAILVNSSKLIYHCGGLPTIVRDKGAELTFEAITGDLENYEPSAGSWASSGEYIRLGSSPVGTVTVDVHNSISNCGDVMETVANHFGFSLSEADRIYMNSVGVIGIDATTLSGLEIIDLICKSSFNNWYIIGQELKISSMESFFSQGYTASISKDDIINFSITKGSLGTGGVPSWKVTVSYDNLQSTQTDFLGIVGDNERQRFSTKNRSVIGKDYSLKSSCQVSTEIVYNSCLTTSEQSLILADKILQLGSKKLSTYSITVDSSVELNLNNRILLDLAIYNIRETILITSIEYDIKRNRKIIGGVQCLTV